MGLSGVVAFLFVIEPSAYLTDPGRARRYAVSVGLVPSTRAADAPRAFRPLFGSLIKPKNYQTAICSSYYVGVE